MARPSLEELVAPSRTAVVTQECQGAVVGPDAKLVELAAEARRQAIPNLTRLLPAARAAGAEVVHCVVHRRPDGKGSSRNARLFAATQALGVDLDPDGPGGAVVPELGPEPSDVVLSRYHGVGPMSGTDLDIVLRNLGISTVVVTGVSVNVAVTNVVMDAVNLGYDVVVPRDAVAGVPAAYADAVIDHTLSLLATITTTDDLIAAWSPGP